MDRSVVGCSTNYDTPSLKSSGLEDIPCLTLRGWGEGVRKKTATEKSRLSRTSSRLARSRTLPLMLRRQATAQEASTAELPRFPATATAAATSDERPLWQDRAERKETLFVIPWATPVAVPALRFQPLSRGGSLAPTLVRASKRNVAPIPRGHILCRRTTNTLILYFKSFYFLIYIVQFCSIYCQKGRLVYKVQRPCKSTKNTLIRYFKSFYFLISIVQFCSHSCKKRRLVYTVQGLCMSTTHTLIRHFKSGHTIHCFN